MLVLVLYWVAVVSCEGVSFVVAMVTRCHNTVVLSRTCGGEKSKDG